MEFINNQYRVLQEQIAGSTFLVRDLYDNKRKIAAVVDSEYISSELLAFFSREYSFYRNISSAYILKSLDFGIVKKINGKKNNQLQYYMISEYAGDTISALPAGTDIIKLFADACKAAHYLHLNDRVFGEICLDTIVITVDEGNYSLKFEDLASIALYKHSGRSNIYFKSPEAVYDGVYDISSDIYSLGVLLFTLSGAAGGESKSFRADFDVYKSNCKDSFRQKLIPFIEEMTCDKKTRYRSIPKILADLNRAFGTDYKAFVHSEVNHPNVNTPPVGRENELNAIISAFDKIVTNNSNKHVVFVHGVFGVGKSTLLRDLYTRLYLKNINIYASFDNKTDGAIKAILRQLLDDYADTESDISDLMKYIYSYAGNTGGSNTVTQLPQSRAVIQGISGGKERGDINSIIKFIYDCVKDKPVIFIVDDLDKANAYTINTLEKLLSVNKKMMLVASYRNSFENETLDSFIGRQGGSCLDFDLQALNEAETALLLQQSLSLPNTPQVLAKAVYSKTGGNPLFAVEVLKNLVINGTVYRMENNGAWHIDCEPEDYKKIPIPATIKQAVREFANKVDALSRKLLTALSVFNIPVYADEITECLRSDAESVALTLDKCVANGYLNALQSSKGVRYSFANNILKDYLYNAMDYYTKRNGHALAAQSLINSAKTTDSIYDEIIYQFEKAGRNDETLLQYLLANGEKYANLSEHDKAIENFIKALEIMEQLEQEDGIPHVMMDISNLYSLIANREKKMEFIGMAADFVINHDNQRNKVSILSVCAYKARKEYFHVAKALFDEQPSLKTEYPADYASLLDTEAYHFETDYNKKMELYDKAFAICPPDDYRVKAKLLTNYSLIHYFNNNPVEALRIMREALEANEKSNSRSNYAISLSNIADLHVTYFYDYQTAADLYRECIDYSVRYRLSNVQWISMNGLLYCHMRELNCKEALTVAQDAMLLSEMINSSEGVESCSIKLHSIYISMEQFGKAYDISGSISKMLDEDFEYLNLEHGEIVLSYYEQCVRFAIFMGDTELAQTYLDIETARSEGVTCLNMIPFIFCEFLKIETCDRPELDVTAPQVYKKIRELTESKHTQPDIIDIMCNLFITFNRYECLPYIGSAFREELSRISAYKSLPMIVLAKLRYLQSLTKTGLAKINTLLEAYNAASDVGLTLTLSAICTALGDCCAGTSRYHSIHYFAEACQIVQGIISGLPEQFKVSFIKKHNLLVPFDRILSFNKKKPSFGNNILDIVFYKDLFTDMLTDARLQSSAKEAYFSKLPYSIGKKADILKHLSDSPARNLGFIAKYLAAMTLASRCEIIADDDENKENEFIVIASNDDNINMLSDKRMLKRVKTYQSDVLMKDEADGQKAVMCIPADGCGGYIYLHSNSIFNNFTSDSMNECKWFMKLIGININLYKIKASSSLDKLTGALNRISLEAAFDSYIKKAGETGSVFSVIFIDLDHFKSVNDIYGHQAGDDVLRAVGKLIMANIRKDTVFGRYGGEEFILLLDGAGCQAALALANKLRMLIDDAKLLGSKRPVTGSMGIAEYGIHDTSKAGLIEKADKALYICKQNGRNLCEIWNPAYTGAAKSENTLDGLITGDTIKDGARLRTLLDMIELIKADMHAEEKIGIYLSKILEMTEAETGRFLIINNGAVIGQYVRHSADDKEQGIYEYEVVSGIIKNKESFGGVVGKQSVICSPVIKNEAVIGALYLSSSANKKELKLTDVGFINYLCGLTAAVVD